MITLLSTLASFLAGGLPKILDFIQDRSDKSQELKLAELQIERELAMAEKGYLAQLQIEEVKTEQIQTKTKADVSQALLQHDIAIGKGASKWVINLRASVRPVITYCMFGMLAFINIFGCMYAAYSDVPFQVAIGILWSQDMQIVFASVISFWFGSTAFSKK